MSATELAGEPITAKLTTAPGNGAPLGGLKVTTENAWFAARPSGTEDVYKIYAESFKGPEHLAEVQQAAKDVVNSVIREYRHHKAQREFRRGGRLSGFGGQERSDPGRKPAAERAAR